jgi:hypothetical protein
MRFLKMITLLFAAAFLLPTGFTSSIQNQPATEAPRFNEVYGHVAEVEHPILKWLKKEAL